MTSEVLVNMEQQQQQIDVSEGNNNTNSTCGVGGSSQLPIHLLIVVGQTFGKEEKKIVLDRINSSLVSIGDSLVELKEDLNTAVQSQFDSVKFDQENRIVYNNETSLQLDILINSTGKTLRKAFRDFLQSHSKNKHFICATLDSNSNGDFNLQDSLFSYDNLNSLLNESEAKKLLLNTDNSIKLHLNSKLIDLNKHWKSLEKQHKNIHLVDSQSTSTISNTNYTEFLSGLDKLLNELPISTLMESSKLTGTLRINKPLLYIFPARHGDSAYFTVNGYSILINGGYDRVKPCFWTFVNMLAQIDSILITHPDSDALGGLGSFFAKKLVDPELKPNVLAVLGNLIASADYVSSPETAQLAANLIASESATIVQQGDGASKPNQSLSSSYVDLIIDSIHRLKITLMPLIKLNDQLIPKQHNNHLNNFAKYEHINLFFKLGQGSLDLYILSPFANSADYKEFVLQQQTHLAKHSTHQKSHLNPDQLFKSIPMSHVTSAVVLLVWMPHVTKQSALAGENRALRLLFPGNAPQHVVINALEKVKDFEILSCPIYKVKPFVNNHSENITVHTSNKKPSSSNGNPPPKSSSSSLTSTTTSKSNLLSTKPPMMAAKQLSNNNSNNNNNTENNKAATNTNGTTSDITNSKPKPKSAPIIVNNTTKATAEKKQQPAAAGGPVNKKTNEKKGTNTNSADAVSSVVRQSLSKPAPSTVTSTSTATTASKQPPTAAAAATSARTTASAPQTGPNNSKPVPAKKTLQPNRSSASKLIPNPEISEEEKKQSRIITKRDPKHSSTKPTLSKAAPKDTAKHGGASVLSATVESVIPVIVAASTDSVAVSVDESNSLAASASADLLAGSVASSIDQDVFIAVPIVATAELPVRGGALENDAGETTRNNVNTAEELVLDLQRLSSEVKADNNQSSSEWPNLSPVKRDQLEDEEEKNNSNKIDGHYMEDRNHSIDTSNTSGIDMDTEGKERKEINFLISDAKDLIQTPEDESAPSAFDNLVNGGDKDVMTRSFIDDGTNNPFAADTNKAANDSINDLNKTHELSDTDGDNTGDDNQDLDVLTKDPEPEFESKPEEKQVEEEDCEESNRDVAEQQHSNTLDDLLNGFNNIKIDESNGHNNNDEDQEDVQHTVENGHENGENHQNTELVALKDNDFCESSMEEGEIRDEIDDGDYELSKKPELVIMKSCHQQEAKTTISSGVVTQSDDPSKWNLLELPKPVTPADLPVTASSEKDKKITSPIQEKTTRLNSSTSKSSTSAAKAAYNVHPTYLELTYIPAHGDSAYVDIDFFRKVRARHYVLSTEEPSEKLLNSILEAKETWGDDKSMLTTIIPTYESEVLKKWYMSNEETLIRLKIDITPTANMSTLTLDDNPDLICQLFKLEF